ncbi:MAG: hypothetical protein SGILL_006572 [Bacillariaceae sp.]
MNQALLISSNEESKMVATDTSTIMTDAVVREADLAGLVLLLEHGLVSLPSSNDENQVHVFLNNQSHLGMLLPVTKNEEGKKMQQIENATPSSPRLVSSWGTEHPNVQFDILESNDAVVTVLDLGGKRLYKGFPFSPKACFGTFSSLTTLNLAGTDLPLKDVLEILALPNVVENIESLYLGGNGLRDDGALAIASNFLKTARKLRKLDLRYNDIQVTGMEAICNALGSNSIVQYLYIEGNQIGNDGAAALANLLVQQGSNGHNSNVPLQEVFLGANRIQAEGAKALAESLFKNKHLSKLYLEGNNIGLDGANAFSLVLEELRGDTALKNLFADNNNIGKEGSKRLAKALNSATAIVDSILE